MYGNRGNTVLTKPSKVSVHFSDGSSGSSESCGHGESWESSHSSSCSACTASGSDDEFIEWESEVQHDGELCYIECDQSYQAKGTNDCNNESSYAGGRTIDGSKSTMKEQSSKSWRNGGKLVRLIRQRESKRHRNNISKASETLGRSNNQNLEPTVHDNLILPFSVSKETDMHVVELHVDPWVKPNLGRRATISETLLGLVTVSDDLGVTVTDYVPDSLAAKQSMIKIGDRVHSINGKPVTSKNFNSHLEAVCAPTTLQLGVSSNPNISEEERNTTVTKSSKISYQTPLAEQISRRSTNSEELQNLLLQSPVGILFLQLDGLTEGGPEDQGVLYCYPGTLKTNSLGLVRGAFLTLFQLIPDISHSIPQSSSIVVRNQLTHVVYIQEGRELLLIAVPSNRCSVPEATKQCTELVRFLQFSYQSLSRCFSSSEYRQAVNHLVSIFLLRLLFAERWAEITDAASFETLAARTLPAIPQFELVLPAAHLVPLPREAQIQLDDALSELESNDIGDACEDLDCQRLYTILGCCIYHKGFLLASHLSHVDLLDVHAFCRQQGLLQLNHSESLKSLVMWKEVFPASVSRGLQSKPSESLSAYSIPGGRWFILIVGQKHDILVSLLEAGGCSASVEGHPSPDAFYVEAAQDTLQHLVKIGISSIASEWIETQLRPKVTTPEMFAASRVSPRKVNNLLGLRVPHDPSWQTSFSSMLSSPSTRKSTDSLGVGKKRQSPDHSSSGPLHGETSEDSASLVASLPSDDTGFVPMKARSEKYHGTLISLSDHEASEDSDSDWDASDVQTGQRLTSTMDMLDLHNSLLKSVEGTVPSKLTMGDENIVFHYVHIDTNKGILLSPVHSSVSPSFSDILSNFSYSAMHIHVLFQNTISFKKLKGVEASHSLINKSLVAIKEFGLLFECQVTLRGGEKATPLTYWVVGRLFLMPTPREVYVCYEDSAPQNLVELAFRIAITTTG